MHASSPMNLPSRPARLALHIDTLGSAHAAVGAGALHYFRQVDGVWGRSDLNVSGHPLSLGLDPDGQVRVDYWSRGLRRAIRVPEPGHVVIRAFEEDDEHLVRAVAGIHVYPWEGAEPRSRVLDVNGACVVRERAGTSTGMSAHHAPLLVNGLLQEARIDSGWSASGWRSTYEPTSFSRPLFGSEAVRVEGTPDAGAEAYNLEAEVPDEVELLEPATGWTLDMDGPVRVAWTPGNGTRVVVQLYTASKGDSPVNTLMECELEGDPGELVLPAAMVRQVPMYSGGSARIRISRLVVAHKTLSTGDRIELRAERTRVRMFPYAD